MRLSWYDRLALWIANHVGTTGVFAFLVGFTILWIGWNRFASDELLFDKPWEFVGWSLICNVIQLLLLPLLLAGQNLQQRHEEARTKHDLAIDEKTEEEIELIVQQLEKQNMMLKALLERQETKGT